MYGAINGANVYRPNALTGDPNHLGIMLIVPLLILTPLYLRLEPGHRMRRWLMLTIGFLLVVEAATLSRSGLLGLAAGGLVLAIPYRNYLRSRALLVPVGAALALLLAVVLSRRSFFTTILKSRVQTSGGSENAHFQVYSFIPHVLHTDPLFGLGLNTFSVYYEFVTGKTNWGPHSYYVALLVETGFVGTALFAVFLWWVFRRLRVARALGRALAAARDPLAARVRPLAWGCTAALVGHARVERLLPDDAVLLLLRVHRARARSPRRLRRAANEGRRPHDVVPTRRGRRRGDLRGGGRRGRARAGRRGRRRVARVVRGLRHRLRRRDRAEPARGAVEAGARAGVHGRLRARRPACGE